LRVQGRIEGKGAEEVPLAAVLRLIHRHHRRAARVMHGVLRIGGVGGIGHPRGVHIIGLGGGYSIRKGWDMEAP